MKFIRVALISFGVLYTLYFLNSSIRAMEDIKTNGQSIYLSLAPVDPREFMTGDYMALGYDNESWPRNKNDIAPEGFAVLKLDQNMVGTFARIDNGTPLALGEIIIRYAITSRGFNYGGNRFYFQEGTATIYEDADYGLFKVNPSGHAILIALANEKFETLKPKTKPTP